MPYILTRKQAIILAAIPQQIKFMVKQGYAPVWEVFSRSTAWKETQDNLRLDSNDRAYYQEQWQIELNKVIKRGGGANGFTQ